jgi:amino acid adenylation domain-containing protein
MSAQRPSWFLPEHGPLTLHAIFSRVASRFPDRIAVSDDRTQLTYHELDQRAEQLAGALRAAGVERDQRVGLCIERSCDLVVGVLGILKAAGCYVPIDPAYPAERRDHILDACQAGIVVASRATAELVPNRRVIQVDARSTDAAHAAPERTPPSPDAASSLAYVIFTSGSSGQPKGVMIEHRNVVRLFTETQPVFGFDESDVWCNFHSIAFDFSVWEIWGALLYGGRLVMVSKEVARDPEAFHQQLRRDAVTVLNQTPSSFRNFMIADARAGDSGPPLALRYVIFGGERLDYRTLAPWAERHGLERPALINMYGITETTVHVTWQRVVASDLHNDGPSPIGVPIGDLKLDIVDASGRSVPPGTEGLIYVAGAGLARGYLGHPELTRERFPERGDHRERWYNSGDLGVEIRPGEFAYVGRADRQLKIRGYRIEPGEIEACIKSHPAVRDCVVIAADFGEGDPRLVAYLVASCATTADRESLISELQASASRALPRFMAPSMYLYVDAIPVTVNGKLDQDALRKLLDKQRSAAVNDGAGSPTSSIEDNLRSTWSSLLGVDQIGDEDEFFDLGGTSFSLIAMLNLVNQRFRTNLKISVFSEGANIATLARAVKSQLGSTSTNGTHHV